MKRNGSGQPLSKKERPSAITGTWSDIERQADYIFQTADPMSVEWMLAEALLVLLTPR